MSQHHHNKGTVIIEKAGMLTSVQDAGRVGYLADGLPAAGCMDSYSQGLANWLVGNPPEQGVLEVTLVGPVLRFTATAMVAIVGADFDITINDEKVDASQTLFPNGGDTIQFGILHSGCRAYIAIAGGFDIDSVLGSQSTYIPAGLGGFEGRALQKGDRLSFTPNVKTGVLDKKILPKPLNIQYQRQAMLRAVKGVEWDGFTPEAQSLFFSTDFTVSPQSNRMGYRLVMGTNLPKKLEGYHQQMITTGLASASVQVTAEGDPIITMKDGQTSGGYPRIANIIQADRHLLGQLKPGDNVRFYQVSLEKAIILHREKQQWINQLLSPIA